MPLILPARTLDSGFNIDNSLRFNSGDSARLEKTFGTNTSERKKTFSLWFKRSKLGVYQSLFDTTVTGNVEGGVEITNEDRIQVTDRDATDGTGDIFLPTSMVFRDPSAWYHLVVAMDTTQGTDTNRVKVYVNGSQVTSFTTTTYPTQNYDIQSFKSSVANYIGANVSSAYYDGYISEFYFIDGQQKAASVFGEFNDNGVWIPKDPTDVKENVTFGDNGFFLEFKQTGTSANSSGMGADTSGEDNHFAVTNLAALDITVDTPTNNFATLNPLNLRLGKGITFSEGNTQIQTGTTGGTVGGFSTIAGLKSGKWYAEFKPTVVGTNGTMRFGIESTDFMAAAGLCNVAASAYASNGNKGRNATDTSHGDSFDDDDIIGVAVDLDNGAIYFSKNGTWQNSSDPESGASKTNAAYTDILTVLPDGGYMFAFNLVYNNSQQETVQANFGNPCNAISSGNADGNGYGNFEYAVPSGYYALCTKNLAEYG